MGPSAVVSLKASATTPRDPSAEYPSSAISAVDTARSERGISKLSHIRRGLEQRFPRKSLGETRRQFAHRMANVQAYMNSPEFAAQDGGGLLALAESFRERCRQVVLLKGERLRT